MAKNHQRSKWGEYFASIKNQCPWSYSAWLHGQIDIVDWENSVLALGEYQARVYIVYAENSVVERIAEELNEGVCEWLFSYPEYGKFATPEKVLIQQLRSTLTELRKKHG